MGRWQPDAMGRLQLAALELFADQGFEQTTVAEISQRAGLTERTFFRHFADKREVLFAGSSEVQERMIVAVAEAPADDPPIHAVARALDAVAGIMQERLEFARVRAAVVADNPELQERELIKLAMWASILAEELGKRGVKEPIASLTAEAGIAAFRVGFSRWVSDSRKRDLATLIRNSLDQLRTVTAEI